MTDKIPYQDCKTEAVVIHPAVTNKRPASIRGLDAPDFVKDILDLCWRTHSRPPMGWCLNAVVTGMLQLYLASWFAGIKTSDQVMGIRSQTYRIEGRDWFVLKNPDSIEVVGEISPVAAFRDIPASYVPRTISPILDLTYRNPQICAVLSWRQSHCSEP